MKKPEPNRTPDGQLACAFGVPWVDHFLPTGGTGKGCPACYGALLASTGQGELFPDGSILMATRRIA